MATTITVSGNGSSGPYSVSAIDWHPYGLLQEQSVVFKLDATGSAAPLIYGDDYTFNQELQSITLVGDTISSLESIKVTRQTPNTFFASLPDLGVADAISAKSNDLQVMNRLNEVEADLAQVSGEVSLTYEGNAFTSVSAGSNISMSVSGSDLLISSTATSGEGPGGGFTDAQFGNGKPAQSSGDSPFLLLNFDTTGFYGADELALWFVDNEIVNDEALDTALSGFRGTEVSQDIAAAIAPFTVKSVSNSDGKIGVTNTNGDVELSYTGPDPVAAPTGSMVMWCGSSAPADLPDGWALCDGSAIDSTSDATFADLFAVIGTAFGGSGAASFNLPDMRGSVPVGVNGLSPELGGTGGNTDTTLARNQIPKHSHDSGTFETRPHYHNTVAMTETSTRMDQTTAPYIAYKGTSSYTISAVSTTPSDGRTGLPKSSTSGHVNAEGEIDVIGKTGNEIYSTTSDTSPEGSQQSVSLMQPYVGVHYIIKK